MSYIRVVSSPSNMNSWERNQPDLSKLCKAFHPIDEPENDSNGKEIWSNVSVFRADTWPLVRACAAAVMFANSPDKWNSSCCVIRLDTEQITSTQLTLVQSSKTESGDPQTCFDNLNKLHFDLSGLKDNFQKIVTEAYKSHSKYGNTIVPITYLALLEGVQSLKQFAEIPSAKKRSSLDRLTSSIEKSLDQNFPFPKDVIDPF